MKDNYKFSWWRFANGLGVFFVVLFVICFFWYYIRPVEQELHISLLRLAYFGFDGMNLSSFILGAVQSYIWAYIAVGIWYLVGCACKTCSVCEVKKETGEGEKKEM